MTRDKYKFYNRRLRAGVCPICGADTISQTAPDKLRSIPAFPPMPSLQVSGYFDFVGNGFHYEWYGVTRTVKCGSCGLILECLCLPEEYLRFPIKY
jgi:hypothetical protein